MNAQFFEFPRTYELTEIRPLGKLRTDLLNNKFELGYNYLRKYPTDLKGPLYCTVPHGVESHYYQKLRVDLECSYHFKDTPNPDTLTTAFDFAAFPEKAYFLQGYIDQLTHMESYIDAMWPNLDVTLDLMNITLSKVTKEYQIRHHNYNSVSSAMKKLGLEKDRGFLPRLHAAVDSKDVINIEVEHRYNNKSWKAHFINIDETSMWYAIDDIEYQSLDQIESINIRFYRSMWETSPFIESNSISGIHDILFTCMNFPDALFFDGILFHKAPTNVQIEMQLKGDASPRVMEIFFNGIAEPFNLYNILLNLAQSKSGGSEIDGRTGRTGNQCISAKD